MITITPDSELRILQNVPFDREHTHTCLFSSVQEQTVYMRLKTKLSLANVSYTRATLNSVKIQARIEDLYNCNYLMFKNNSFENKWFYAFIDDVAYINNTTCEVRFTIDALQTWLLDFTLGECFVEREHSVSDVAGENIVAENVDIGDYVLDNVTKIPGFYDDNGNKSVRYVLWSTLDGDGKPGGTSNYSGYVTAATPYDIQTGSDLNMVASLEERGLAGAIVAYSPIPTKFAEEGTASGVQAPQLFFAVPKSDYCFQNFEGYTPKNNKLYTFPYNYLYVSGFNGSTAEYAFEYFTDVNGSYTASCPFNLLCQIGPTTTVGLAPGDYKGVHYVDGDYNYDEMMKLYTYPQMPFGIDAYKNEVAASVTSAVLGGLQTTLGALALGAPEAAVVGGLGHLAFGVANASVRAGKPVVSKGSWDNLFLFANNLVGGWYARKHIKRQFAEIVDNYFTMFGYATNRLKTPNINSRPHWNYVKTRYCFITGDLPESAKSEIRAIFNRGVTFWKTPGEIGNYSLDNSPT